jgi:ribosomal protein S12 methylthiotransferase accessory factor YcaO
MLTDPTRCKILMVTTAAMTPVMESAEVIHELQHTLSMTLLPIVVNKCERDVPVISAQSLDTPLRDAYEYVSTRMQAQQAALTTLSELTQSEQLHTHRYVTEGTDLVESLSTELVTRIQELP